MFNYHNSVLIHTLMSYCDSFVGPIGWFMSLIGWLESFYFHFPSFSHIFFTYFLGSQTWLPPRNGLQSSLYIHVYMDLIIYLLFSIGRDVDYFLFLWFQSHFSISYFYVHHWFFHILMIKEVYHFIIFSMMSKVVLTLVPLFILLLWSSYDFSISLIIKEVPSSHDYSMMRMVDFFYFVSYFHPLIASIVIM